MKNVACCFKTRLLNLCPSNVLKARGRLANNLYGQDEDYSIHHINIIKTRSLIYICGPYYRSLVEAFNLQFGDTIIFNWNRDAYLFDVSVTSSSGIPKFWIGFPGKFLIFCLIFFS